MAVSLSQEQPEGEALLRVPGQPRRPKPGLWAAAASALVLLGIAVAGWGAGRRWPLAAHLRGSTDMDEEKAQEAPKARSFCGRIEQNVEFHTAASLYAVTDVPSKEMCCAECNGHPDCNAWTWGRRERTEGLTNVCLLKKLSAGEEPLRIKRFGIVSGMPLHKLRKHGVVAKVLSDNGIGSSSVNSAGGEVSANDTCPGRLNITGHGMLSVVAALWREPTMPGTTVAVPTEGWELVPNLGSRAYLAESCAPGRFEHGDYAALKLLGKTLRYYVDLSGASCGCNARVSLVPMKQNMNRSGCHDYYCSGRSNSCGVRCAELALQDANQYAWSSSLLAHDDANGTSMGYGGGATGIGRRDWSDAQYGPGAECIDTTWPFQVKASFPVNKDGQLDALEITLLQDGRTCPLHARVDTYRVQGRDALAELGTVLEQGVTPVLEYSGSHEQLWLDGIGLDGQGPCVRDTPQACSASVRFYGFVVEVGAERSAAPRVRAPKSRGSPLEVAMAAVHQSVTTRAQELRQEGLDNATALREAAAAGGGLDCGPDCSALGVGVPVRGGDNITRNSLYEETSDDRSEWEVLALVNVRSTRNLSGRILGEKIAGEITIGERIGDWINVAHEPGFIPITEDGRTLLKERTVSYQKIIIGSCSETGLHPIDDARVCGAAAFALGYFDTTVTTFHGPQKRPQGCYVLNGQVFSATHKNNRGNGADGHRMPICASRSYPTTITTTSTTTTTTRTTVTSTTTTTTTTWGFPSLFCFEVMMTTTYEFGLVKEQIRKGAGIFTCDEYGVFSQDNRTFLGQGPNGPPIHTIWFQKAPVWTSQDNTAANTLLFMHLWDALKKDGRWEHHDWTVKADPDAVVLPWRIRTHLGKATGPNNYLVNCNKYPGNPNFPMIFGAFEAYSKLALRTYFNGGDVRCRTELQWKMWGEDFFMHHCMMHLGVQQFDDFGILSDKRCTGANCADGWAAAYHDFKSQDSWFACWDQAVR